MSGQTSEPDSNPIQNDELDVTNTAKGSQESPPQIFKMSIDYLQDLKKLTFSNYLKPFHKVKTFLQQQLSEQSPQIDSSASGASPEEEPKMFKLSADSLQEIFDYLSLEDIHAVAQTCKLLKVIACDYFKWNLSAVRTSYCGEYHPLNAFIEIMPKLDILTQGENTEECRAISLSCKSLKNIYITSHELDATNIQLIAEALNNIEAVSFFGPDIGVEFYDGFFKHCINCKHLRIRSYTHTRTWGIHWNDIIIGRNNDWLNRSYPALECLELNLDGFEPPINNLGNFLALNPNVQTLAVDCTTLSKSHSSLLEANIKLRVLAVMVNNGLQNRRVNIFELLHSLHAHGIYQRLHLFVRSPNQQTIDHISSTYGLEKLYLQDIDNGLVLSSLASINELALISCHDNFDVRTTATNLTNLKRLYFTYAKPKTIRTFIQHSPNLKAIKVETIFDERLGLITLNKLRAELAAANKVVIYLGEEAFLAEKWSNIADDSDMVIIKRAESKEWHIPFHEFLNQWTPRLKMSPQIATPETLKFDFELQ